MTEGTEHALEYAFSGGVFCMAVVLVLWLHRTSCEQLQNVGKLPEQMILFEENGG